MHDRDVLTAAVIVQAINGLKGPVPVAVATEGWEETAEEIDNAVLGIADIWCAAPLCTTCRTRRCLCSKHVVSASCAVFCPTRTAHLVCASQHMLETGN